VYIVMSEVTVLEQGVLGQVKWFNNKTGYGFVTVVSDSPNKGKDIFAHYSNLKIEKSQYKYLIQGEYIQFDLVKPDKGNHEFHAVGMTGVCGGSMMCEVKYELSQERTTKKRQDESADSEWTTSGKK
jgi:cold shock CspA family protein